MNLLFHHHHLLSVLIYAALYMLVCVCVCVQYEDVADKDDLMGVEDTAKKGESLKATSRANSSALWFKAREQKCWARAQGSGVGVGA